MKLTDKLPEGWSITQDRTYLQRQLYGKLLSEVRIHNNTYPQNLKKVKYVNGVPVIADAEENELTTIKDTNLEPAKIPQPPVIKRGPGRPSNQTAPPTHITENLNENDALLDKNTSSDKIAGNNSNFPTISQTFISNSSKGTTIPNQFKRRTQDNTEQNFQKITKHQKTK